MVLSYGWLSGDTDGRVPVLSTRYSISALGLPITKAWTPWYHQKQVIDQLNLASLGKIMEVTNKILTSSIDSLYPSLI